MELTESEKLTIKRAFIIYDKNMYKGLKGKGFFIDAVTCKQDIKNMISIEKKLEGY